MKIPFNKPTLPDYGLFRSGIEEIYSTGMITNSKFVTKLEGEVADGLRVSNVTGVACCTSGLMLAIKCLGLKGKVALPSFTFFASAHAIAWNGLEPVFVDIDPDTFNISVDSLRAAVEKDDEICAALPVHVFGNPCDVDGLAALSDGFGLSLVYDSAHGMGARAGDRPVGGFGDAEVFSLSPTKLVVAGEGGIITSNNDELADRLRVARDYGNAGDYNPEIIGLNARMSEFHAALAIESFRMLEQNVFRRNEIASRYKEGLSKLPGITFQKIEPGNRSTYKDLTILIDEERFGISRDALAWHLSNEGIDTRKYYQPPVHRISAYREKWGSRYDELLPVTNRISAQALSLPIWSHMELDLVDTVADAVRNAHITADEIAETFNEAGADS